MSKLKTRVGTWVLVLLKELGAGPGLAAGTHPASPQQRQRRARVEAGWKHGRAPQHV